MVACIARTCDRYVGLGMKWALRLNYAAELASSIAAHFLSRQWLLLLLDAMARVTADEAGFLLSVVTTLMLRGICCDSYLSYELSAASLALPNR